MKRLAIALLLIIGLASPSAEAGLISGSIIQVDYTIGTTSGGAFKIVGADSFWTFCIELDETFQYDTDYSVELATAAVHGGAGGPDPDPLSSESAYLYWLFTTGALNPLDTDHIDGLQLAFWRLEEELTATYFTVGPGPVQLGNPFSRQYADEYISQVAGASGLYGVQVMQLWDCSATGADCVAKQDMLYRVPDGGATLMLLGGALVGLGALRRRFGA